MPEVHSAHPDWTWLRATASGQAGLFSTQQAAEAGCSSQLLTHHLRGGRIQRLMQGTYRLVQFRAAEHQALALAWLCSERAGTISHQSALGLHGPLDGVSDVLHLTVPTLWHRPRRRVPVGSVLHHAEIEPSERDWCGSIPITSPWRSLSDCSRDGLAPELLRQATQRALDRGEIADSEITQVQAATGACWGREREGWGQ